MSKPSAKNHTHHYWAMEIKTIGHTMPLLRILVILRKFRVEVATITLKRHDEKHYRGFFLLNFHLSTRTNTVFKKISRLFDIAKLRYQKGKKVTSKASILK